MKKLFQLNPDCYLIQSEPHQFHLRKGIWNHIEVVVDVKIEPQELRSAFADFFVQLGNHRPIEFDLELLKSFDQGTKVLETLDQLCNELFIEDASKAVPTNTEFRFGYISDGMIPQLQIPNVDFGFGLDIIQPSEIAELNNLELFSRVSGYDYVDALETTKKVFKDFDGLIVNLAHPNLRLARNINRVALHLRKPVIYGLVDGPFSHLLASSSNSGCFECFESRILARMEDSHAYHVFASGRNMFTHRGSLAKQRIHDVIGSLILQECTDYVFQGHSKYEGRVLSIYWPVMEIQAQDLLRISSCPACGLQASMFSEEIYSSTLSLLRGNK